MSPLRYTRGRLKAALATPESITVSGERAWLRVGLLAAILSALWFILCRQLSGEWWLNEQYSYGWFVPVFCVYLFWLRWEDRPQAESAAEAPNSKFQIPNPAAIIIAIAALLLLLPLRVFEIGNPDWRPLSWLHAVIVVTLTLLALWWIGGGSWVRHFVFPVAFILVAVPWITPIEQPIVQGLMRGVAAMATEMLSLCGIPAQVEGNLIRISSGVVGVNEACSGVRALQTAIMIGLLLGELKRFTVGRRAILVAVAIGLSMFANFLRTFLLVLIAANEGVGAVDRWHDLAGYSIVTLVFLGTLGAAALLGSGKGKDQRSEIRRQKSGNPFLILHPSSLLFFVLAWLVMVEIASGAWYRAHEHDLVARTRWSVRLPANLPGFRDLKISESVRQTLRFDEGRAGRWHAEPGGAGLTSAGAAQDTARLHCTLFFFRWNPGGGTLLRARAHRPDICLPSSGWDQTADDGVKPYAVDADVALPFQHLEFVRKPRGPLETSQFAHTFFCLQQDWVERKNMGASRAAVASNESHDWGVLARVRAVENGLRDLGQQSLELVFITPEPLNAAAAEAQLAALLPPLIKVDDARSVTK